MIKYCPAASAAGRSSWATSASKPPSRSTAAAATTAAGGRIRARPLPTSVPIDTPAGREVLLKVLSGVARAKGRFGKIAVAQMLTGSDSERMSKWKLDQLSTFGILRDSGFTRKDLSDIIDALTRTSSSRPRTSIATSRWSLLPIKAGAGSAARNRPTWSSICPMICSHAPSRRRTHRTGRRKVLRRPGCRSPCLRRRIIAEPEPAENPNWRATRCGSNSSRSIRPAASSSNRLTASSLIRRSKPW